MPTDSKNKSKGRNKPVSALLADEDDDYLDDYTEPTSSSNRGKKRGLMDDVYEAGSTSTGGANEVEKMLASFGADFAKTIENKRKKLDTFTDETVKSSNKKMNEMAHKQQKERLILMMMEHIVMIWGFVIRHKLMESYSTQIAAVLSQWEEDMQKFKEGEEKMTSLVKQQQKMYQQQRLVQTQRYKTIKQLQEEYMKNIELLEENHQKQLSTMHDDLKQEMVALRKRILMESQQREMSSVRRSLQLLAQVGEE
jgi:synaptonemal complex protein 3